MWSSLADDAAPSYEKARDILALQPADRKPFKSREETLAFKNRTLLTLLAAGGLVGAMVLMVGNELLRDWMTNGYVV